MQTMNKGKIETTERIELLRNSREKRKLFGPRFVDNWHINIRGLFYANPSFSKNCCGAI